MSETANKLRRRARTRSNTPKSIDLNLRSSAQALVSVVTNNRSLTGDGSNKFVLVDNAYKGIIGNNPFSVGQWVKFPTTPSTRSTPFYWGGLANNGGLVELIIQTDGKWRIEVLGPTMISDSPFPSIFDNAWHFIVVTSKSAGLVSDMKMYLDGLEVPSSLSGTDVPVNIAADRTMSVGREFNHGTFFDGLIDEFSLWSTELTAAEISSLYSANKPVDLTSDGGDYVSSSSLEIWYRFESDSSVGSSGIKDASGNVRTGTTTGFVSGDFTSDAP